MRHVVRLEITVGVSSPCELFIIGNIKELESSMQQLCVEEGELKAVLKIALGTLVKQCSRILIDHFGQKVVTNEIHLSKQVQHCLPKPECDRLSSVETEAGATLSSQARV